MKKKSWSKAGLTLLMLEEAEALPPLLFFAPTTNE
jgi:hypothetical protein